MSTEKEVNEKTKQMYECLKEGQNIISKMSEKDRDRFFTKISLIDSGAIPTDNKVYIYVDLPCIVDFKLGEILHYTYVNYPETYNEVLTHIQTKTQEVEYNNRILDDVEINFPELKYSQKDIDDCISNSKLEDIILHAPFSSGIILIKKFMSKIEPLFIEEKEFDITDAVGIVLNIYSDKGEIPNYYKDLVCKFIVHSLKTKDIRLVKNVHTNTYLSDKSLVRKFLTFFIYDLKSFLETAKIKDMFEKFEGDSIELPFTNKYLFGYKTVYSKEMLGKFDTDEHARRYLNVEVKSYLAIMTNFDYFSTYPLLRD